MMKRLLLLLLVAVSCAPKDGEYVFRILTTNDVHGCYFDSLYVEKGVRNSLVSVSWYVDSIRTAAGPENVILLDAGDCLQGDNASYYYNFVDTLSEHVFARIIEYMKYDAVVVGNHDIETGHRVYDRVMKDMDVPFLAANAIRTDGIGAYFSEYTLLRRNGLRIAVIGFTNPNIPNWLSSDLWEGMRFEDLVPYAQQVVDKVRAAENPDVVIVAVHAGTGKGDMSQKENAGLDLYRTLTGVDLLVCAHDHRPVVHDADSICLVNAGSRCGNIGEGIVTLKVENGKVVSKNVDGRLIRVDRSRRDTVMSRMFHDDFEKVREFTCREIGTLKSDLRTRDAYTGMSDYINLLHREKKTELHFSEDDKRQLYLAAMLHDVGKMDTPLEVMDKPTKLGDREKELRNRLEIISLHIKNDALSAVITQNEADARLAKIQEFIDKLGAFNCGRPLKDDEWALINEIEESVYTSPDGKEIPYLSTEERDDLHIKAGTLSDAERTIMQNHVVYTDKILSHMQFDEKFKDVRKMASNHHELLNGKGYPNGIGGDNLDTMTRILTIMDIYDALIADDRPYKKPKPNDIAFKILDEEAEFGKIDKGLLEFAKALYLKPTADSDKQ